MEENRGVNLGEKKKDLGEMITAMELEIYTPG